jgi:hypothetical protein
MRGYDPISISEQLQYSTIRIETDKGNGTGFYFSFKIREKEIPIIITNKHVVDNKNNKQIRFSFHTNDRNFKTMTIERNWIFHPKKDIDLCFCFIADIIEQYNIYYKPIEEELIWGNEKLKDLSTIEDVIMIGYPEGLSNEKYNLPLFRKGITASHPAIDFKPKGIPDNTGVVDLACFPGSSGSPIFILNEGTYYNKVGNSLTIGSRIILLGILFVGPSFNSEGEIKILTQQKISVSTMINLGYYIKSQEILNFKKLIEQKLP